MGTRAELVKNRMMMGNSPASPADSGSRIRPGPAALLIAAAILAGAVRGLFTLLEATSISDRWGPAGYASLNGVFSAPLTAAIALAPTAGVALGRRLGSYPALFLALAGTSVISGALMIGTGTGAGPQDQVGGQTGGRTS